MIASRLGLLHTGRSQSDRHVSAPVPLSCLLNWYTHREQRHRFNVGLAVLGVKPVV